MTQLSIVQGGYGRQTVWSRPIGGGEGLIRVLNGRSQGEVLRDPVGVFSVKWIPRGRTVYRTEGASHHLAGRRALILNTRQPYELEFPEGPRSETFCVFYSADLVAQAWSALADPAGDKDAGTPPAFPELVFTPEGAVGAELAALHRALSLADPTAPMTEERLSALLMRLLSGAQAHRLAAGRIPALKPATRRDLLARLVRARDAIDDSPASEVSLDALARESALSKFHLLRHFKSAFGETPAAYARRRRVERASALLRETTRTVTGIAEELGYETAGSLIRAVRRQTGRTPSEIRARWVEAEGRD